MPSTDPSVDNTLASSTSGHDSENRDTTSGELKHEPKQSIWRAFLGPPSLLSWVPNLSGVKVPTFNPILEFSPKGTQLDTPEVSYVGVLLASSLSMFP